MLRKQPRQTSSPFKQQFLTHGEIIFSNEESPELDGGMLPRSKCKALVKRKPLSSVGWVTSFRNPTEIYINGQPA
ncbi:MAG: hypothetical protein WC504_05915, partial [Methylobacter sp.]